MAIGDFNLGGALAGAAGGGVAGSFIPGLGTVLGAGAGFIAGGFGAGAIVGPSTGSEGIADRVISGITGRSMLPSLEQKAEVSVWGNPRSNKQVLYWQAAAIAFGLCKPRATGGAAGLYTKFEPPTSMIALNWNTEENAVHLTLYNRISWGVLELPSVPDEDRRCQIFDGPPLEIRGGQWQWFAGAAAKVFPGTGVGSAMGLGSMVGAVQFTSNPTYVDDNHPGGRIAQSSYPPGDLNSRSYPPLSADPSVRSLDPTAWYTNPEYLLFAALTTPCGTGENTFFAPPPIPFTESLTTDGTRTVPPPEVPWWTRVTLPFIPPLGSSPIPTDPTPPNTDGDGFPFDFPAPVEPDRDGGGDPTPF